MKKKLKKSILSIAEDIKEFNEQVGVDNHFDIAGVKSFNVVKKAEGEKNDARIVKGYATTPDVDWVEDSVSLEAMVSAKDHLMRKGTNTVFYNHDTEQPIGKVLATSIENKGLMTEIEISKAADVESIWTKIKEGILSSFSIRFIPKKIEVVRDDEGFVQEYKILEMEMLEVSIVGLPMNKEANVTEVIGKSAESFFKKKDSIQSEERNNPNGGDDMNVLDAVKECIPGILKESLEAERKSTATLVAETVKSVIAAVDAEKAKSAQAVLDAEEKKTADATVIEGMITEAVKKALKGKTSRKGADEEDEDDDDGGSIKKALKSATDEDTIKFVAHVMDDSAAYAALDASEQEKAKNLYFEMAGTV